MDFKHKGSKFIFDVRTMTLVKGRAPTKEGQLWKGEDIDGQKMELAGTGTDRPVAYWGWSS